MKKGHITILSQDHAICLCIGLISCRRSEHKFV